MQEFIDTEAINDGDETDEHQVLSETGSDKLFIDDNNISLDEEEPANPYLQNGFVNIVVLDKPEPFKKIVCDLCDKTVHEKINI